MSGFVFTLLAFDFFEVVVVVVVELGFRICCMDLRTLTRVNLSRSKKSFMPFETKCEKRKAEHRHMSFDPE